MSRATNQQPLDYPDDEGKKVPESDPYKWLRFVVALFLCVGLVFRIQHWPYGGYLLQAGIWGWIFWNVLLLFRFRRLSVSERFYTFGRLALAGGVGTGWPFALPLVALAALLFVIGIGSAWFGGRRNASKE